ncbi:MAG: hypothetical protein ACKVQV_11800 [Bacteroidia bacterium]
MKKQFLLITTLCLSFFFSSCKKDDDAAPATPTPTPTTKYFFSFNLDGVPKYIYGASNNVNWGSGGGVYSGASIFTLTSDIGITFNMDQDSILGSDFQALIGQKIPFIGCGGCPQTNAYLTYDISGDSFASHDTDNPLPAYYTRITSSTYLGTFNQFGIYYEKYVVTGEFNARISYGGTIKNLTNGTFKLIFPAAFD